MYKIYIYQEFQMSSAKILSLLLLISLPFLMGSSNNNPPEDNPFTITNFTTYSPGTVVTVNLYSYNNAGAEFKFALLKITDPLSFYSKLSSSYSFDIWGRDKDILLRYTEKIRDWKEHVAGNYSYGKGNVAVGKIDEPGIYIVQAIRGELVAYCAVVVSDNAIVYKNSGSQVLVFLTNVKTSEFLKNVKFTLVYNKVTTSLLADKDGLALFNIKQKGHQDFDSRPLLTAQTGKETIISNPYFYFWGSGENLITAYIYTNQPIYRPGQEVSFKAILRDREGNELKNIAGTEFSVSVKSPKNKEVYSQALKANDMGSLYGSLKLEDGADLGNYSILISKGENSYYGSFEVQEYKKPEYQVKIELPKNNYANKDEISGKVKADYYFGSPVNNGTVALKIYKKYYWRPWWYWSDYSWFYKSFDKISPYNWRELTFVQQMDGVLNNKGEYDFSFKVNEEYNADYVYVISAEVTDASRRAVTGNTNVYITRGSFSIFTTPDKYFTETGKPVVLKINAADFNDSPVETDFKVDINYMYPSDGNRHNKDTRKDSLTGRTDKSGKALISYYPRNLGAGYYNYTVSAKDEKGREITTQSSFYYGQNEYYNYNGQGVEIVTDKDSYEKGDSLTAYIFLPSAGTELLVTYESNEIFHYKKINARDKNIVLKEKLGDRFAPSFNLSITFMKDGKFFNNSKQIGVLAKDKFLNISILPDKKEYKPGDNALYKVMVKDFKGNPVKNTELSFGVVDESIYAIKEDETQDIKSFFYAPQYSYIPTNNSYSYSQSSGQSRLLTAIDKNYFDQGSIEQKGNGRLYGNIKNKEGKTFGGIKLILNNKSNFYIATTDTSGNYGFNNIKQGDYSLYYFNAQESLVLINKVVIGKEKKFDAVVDMPIEQLQNVVVNRGGRDGGVLPSVAGADRMELKGAPQMMESSTNTAKVHYVEAVVRSNFADAAYWIPDVRTNDNGMAEVKFKMPDNLTTWRTSVKGITVKTDVGQEINKVITRKDLLIRMETPRFFREGDEITISTIVHNYLNEAKKTKITFNADHLTLLRSTINTPGYSTNVYNQKEGLYEITVDKNTDLRIDWVVNVDIPIGEVKLNAEALTNSESDALQIKVPIIPKGIREVKSVIAEFSDKKEESLQFNIPKDVDLRSANFSFVITPTLAGTILKALDDLAGYPYGCVEQTMSRFLPTIIVANTFTDLKIPLKSYTLTEMPEMVKAGLQRLYSFQHPDGGWGWWTNDNTHPYMTAYVIYGMSLARQAGYPLDEDVYKSGIENLNTQLSNQVDDPTTLSFMLYALSSSKDEKFNSTIYKKIKEMDLNKLNAYALSLNIMSLVNIHESRLANSYAEKLVSMSERKSGMVYWSGKEWHYNWQDDRVQSTSFAVKALIKSGSKSDIISKAVSWLIMQKQGYSWRSTQETAAVIFALSDYLKTTNELNPDYTYSVYLNDKKLVTKKIGAGDVYKQAEEININGLTEKNLINGDNYIKITKEGAGKLYFSGLNQYYESEQSLNTKENTFSVRREYYLLRPEQRDGKIVYTKNDIDDGLKSGDELLVKTFVNTKSDNLQYFILEDMLPSGFEPIKDENKYEIEGENNYRIYPDFRRFRPWRWFYADKEYRDQKVSFFVTNVNREMEFSYLIKAQIPGTVTVSPAQAYLMYYPEVKGNSEWLELKTNDK
jgi:alpha-2-macroglobulin